MIYFCFGYRVNESLQERICPTRDRCPYYANTNLSEALSNPDEYTQLDTYNDKPCQYEKRIY